MFNIPLPDVTRIINTRLLVQPMSWAIVFIIATIWLLAFHTIMTAFAAMQSTKTTAFNAPPGQIAAQSPTAAMFSTPGMLTSGAAEVPGLFQGGASAVWTDSSESKYAEDGWYGNP